MAFESKTRENTLISLDNLKREAKIEVLGQRLFENFKLRFDEENFGDDDKEFWKDFFDYLLQLNNRDLLLEFLWNVSLLMNSDVYRGLKNDTILFNILMEKLEHMFQILAPDYPPIFEKFIKIITSPILPVLAPFVTPFYSD